MLAAFNLGGEESDHSWSCVSGPMMNVPTQASLIMGDENTRRGVHEGGEERGAKDLHSDL